MPYKLGRSRRYPESDGNETVSSFAAAAGIGSLKERGSMSMLTDPASTSVLTEPGSICSGFGRRIGPVEHFGRTRAGLARLVSGWGEREQDHVWNDGFIAVIAVSRRTRPPALILSISGQPYLPTPGHAQEITLYTNGWFAGFWRLDADRPYLLEALIEPEWWLGQGDAHVLQMGLLMPNAARPIKAAWGAERRRLAFCLRTIEFHTA
jgi:hypothetical protein